MIVVSDTSPLNYLVLVGHVEILQTLYERVVVPDVVRNELSHPSAPPAVLEWVKQLPDWIEVRSATAATGSQPHRLDAGELAAMQLAMELRADLLLIDDQPARTEARRLGLPVTGLLGVLTAAALRGLLDLESVLHRLQTQTNFRLKPQLAERAVQHVKAQRQRKDADD